MSPGAVGRVYTRKSTLPNTPSNASRVSLVVFKSLRSTISIKGYLGLRCSGALPGLIHVLGEPVCRRYPGQELSVRVQPHPGVCHGCTHVIKRRHFHRCNIALGKGCVSHPSRISHEDRASEARANTHADLSGRPIGSNTDRILTRIFSGLGICDWVTVRAQAVGFVELFDK